MTLPDHLLLVDDDATFLNILQHSLKYKEIHSTAAQTSEDALELIHTQSFDYAVIDLNIDGESGLNLLKALLEKQSQCKPLILTGYASVATAVEAMRLGAINYLCKPAKVDDILQAFNLEKPDSQGNSTEQATPESEAFHPMSVKRLEWEHIQKVLMEHDGNISATAQALNMHRRTLQRKLQKRPVNK